MSDNYKFPMCLFFHFRSNKFVIKLSRESYQALKKRLQVGKS